MCKEPKETMRIISHQIENINKETEVIKKKQIEILELKDTRGVQQQIWAGRSKNQHPEDKSIEITQSEKQKERKKKKRMKKMNKA